MSDSNTKKLLRNTLVYTIGSLGARILSFLLLPLFSFYLTKSQMGTYDLILTTISMLVPFLTLQISDATYMWLLSSGDDRKKKAAAVSNGLFVLIIASAVFFVILAIASLFYKYEFTLYFAFMLFFSCYLPFFQQAIRGLGENKLYAVAGVINAIVILLLNVSFLVFAGMKLEALFLAVILSNFLTIGFIIYKTEIFNFVSLKHLDWNEMKQMLHYSIPLIPNMISWWLINAADRFIILNYMGADSNGIYAMASRFPAIMTILNSIFILAWQDHTLGSSSVDKEKKYESMVFDKYMTFELTTVLILISVSEIMVRYGIAKSFYDSHSYMPIIYIGVAFSAFAGYYGASFLREKKTKGIFVSSMIAGAINIAMSLVLMKYIGLYAPSLGTFVSFLVMFIIRVRQSKEHFPLKVNYLKLISLTGLCLLFSYLITFRNIKLNILLIVLALVTAVVFNLETINFFINRAKRKLANR